MKKILTLTLAIAAICGFNMNAQSQNKAKVEATAGENNKMRQPKEFTEFAFEGILLSPAQQTRMDSLNAAVKANCPKDKKCDKANCPKDKKCDKANCPKDKKCDKANCPKDKKCDKANCDKANCPKANCDSALNCPRGMKDGKGPRPEMRGPKCPCQNPEYMGKVKEILTPEQYTMFLENVVQYQSQQPKGMGGPKDIKKGHKGERKCNKTCVVSGECPKAKKAQTNMVQAN